MQVAIESMWLSANNLVTKNSSRLGSASLSETTDLLYYEVKLISIIRETHKRWTVTKELLWCIFKINTIGLGVSKVLSQLIHCNQTSSKWVRLARAKRFICATFENTLKTSRWQAWDIWQPSCGINWFVWVYLPLVLVLWLGRPGQDLCSGNHYPH